MQLLVYLFVLNEQYFEGLGYEIKIKILNKLLGLGQIISHFSYHTPHPPPHRPNF
jgi:hypothetical protein